MINTSSDFLEIITSIFAVVKHVTGNDVNGTHEANTSVFRVLYYLFCLVISLLLYVIIVVVSIVLVIPKKIVEFYLSRKYGEQFCGLLEDMDVLWMAETNEAKHIIIVVFFIQLQSKPTEFIDCLKKRIKRTQDIRFNSIFCNTLGFWYRIYSDNIVDDVVRLIPLTQNEQMHKSDFEDKISQLSNKSLPQYSAFEVLVSDKPVIFYDNDFNENNYAVITRVHHSVGNGSSLLNFLSNVADNTHTFNNDKRYISTKTAENLQSTAKLLYLKNALDVVNYAIHTMKNVYVSYFSLVASHDNNPLHGPSLTGEKIVAFHCEKEAEYLTKIKLIKSQVDKCTFSVVMFTAISASICNYFSKYANNISRNMNISYITVPKGTFSVATLKIPIRIDGSASANEDLLHRMKIVAASYARAQGSVEPLVFYWLTRFCSLLPLPITKQLVKINMKSSLSVSNLPGPKSISIDGQPVNDIFFWTPNVGMTGVGFSILTYDGRLQISLVADKALIPERESAAHIVQNIFKYIDLLENEL